MRKLLACVAALGLAGCGQAGRVPGSASPVRAASVKVEAASAQGAGHVGFDRNEYPGDERLAELKQKFEYASFWLNNPPGATTNNWAGRRGPMRQAGFGFLVLFNGKLDAEIKRAGGSAEKLGRKDGAAAIAAAKQEGFPPGTLIFLDQEEGGRLLPEQAAYFFGWTETVAASAYKPGAYLSGQKDRDDPGPGGKPAYITTAQDVREHIAKEHLHEVALWVYDDTCPPAPGCTRAAPSLGASGTEGAVVWQYAQSPRRPELTRSCAKTYAPDNNCYAGATKDLFLDLDVAASADPSHGR